MTALTRVVQGLLPRDPAWAVTAAAVVSAFFLLLLLRLLASPQAVRRSRGRMVAGLLAIRLFRDDPWLTLRGLGEALAGNVLYLRHLLPPLLVALPFVVWVLVQLDLAVARRPLRPGEEAVVTVRLRGGEPPRLEAQPAYEVLTPALVFPALGEAAWRIRALRPGRQALRFAAPGGPFTKELVVAAPGPVSPVRLASSFLERFLHPAEPPLPPGAGVSAVRIGYPERPFRLFGVALPWWLAYLLLTLVLTFLGKGFFRVEL